MSLISLTLSFQWKIYYSQPKISIFYQDKLIVSTCTYFSENYNGFSIVTIKQISTPCSNWVFVVTAPMFTVMSKSPRFPIKSFWLSK